MDTVLAAHRRESVIPLLAPLFVASGATSLVYETLWERQLHLVVGTSQVGVITVLAAFMTGLAAGGFLASRFADRARNPLIAYAVLEGFIGLYAVVFPLLLPLIEPLYLGVWRAFEPAPVPFAVFQFLLLGLFLLPPTICMGATLPLLARFASTDAASAGRRVGLLYGANTMGAVVGVGLAGFVLLPSLGLSMTTWATAGSNVLLCLVAVGLGMWVGPIGQGGAYRQVQAEAPAPDAAPDDTIGLGGPLGLGGIALLAGVSSLICEVAWFRLMVLTLGGSAYAFSLMLLAFLLGIAIGGWVGGPLADRAWSKGGAGRALLLLAGLQAGVAGLVYASMFTYGELPFAFVALYSAVESVPRYLWPAKLVLAVAVMAPPAVLMGATFPVLVRTAARTAELGAPVGRIYGWNTVGAIFGAVLGGLVLLPGLHVVGTMLFAISLNLLAAVLALRASAVARRQPMGISGLGGISLGWLAVVAMVHLVPPPWDPLLMTAGMYKYVSDLEPGERSRAEILEFAVTPYDLVFYDEGFSSVVTVARNKVSGDIWLANNGKVDASTRADMPTQVLVAHLPFLLDKAPEDVLVIGLASGITAGSVTLQPEPRRIDIIELEPAIVAASHVFDDYNHKPLEDPRVRLWANDGRNHVSLMPAATYDLVVSEPSNPWLSGVSNLFTREFFALGKSRLRPGGVWAQWVQMYGMAPEDLRTLLGTFADAYEHVLLFSTIEDADLVLIGSDAPLPFAVDQLQARVELSPAVAEDLRAIDIEDAYDLIARWQMSREMLLAFAEGAVRNTDDNMRIEYSAPLHLHEETADANFLALLDDGGARDSVPQGAVEGREGLVALARAYGKREDYLRALITLKQAQALVEEEQRQRPVDPDADAFDLIDHAGDPEIDALWAEYQSLLVEDFRDKVP